MEKDPFKQRILKHYKKYFKIRPDRYLYPECGKGWYWLIERACELVQWEEKECKRNKKPFEFQFTQIKEKFGTLRLNHYGGTDRTDNFLDCLEHLSAHMCEDCGSTGLDVKTRDDNWLTTLCSKHFQEWQLRTGRTEFKILEE